jgi:DNA-binding MarR family transcriptional regulator
MDQDISQSRENLPPGAAMRFKDAVRANQTATDVFDETLTTFLGVNRTDGRCLDVIDRLGRVSAGQLAIESGLTTGAVTAVIDRLEAAGYVRRIRDSLDRRKIWVETTEDLRAINARIFGFYARMSPVIMSRYTPEQIRAVLEFLEIGTLLNLELAAAMKEHFDPHATTAAARLIQARAFERAMEANSGRLMKEVETIGLKVGNDL